MKTLKSHSHTNSVLTMSSTPDYQNWKPVQVYGCDFRPSLKDMADTVDRLELWDWFKNESPPEDCGYTYWKHENMIKYLRVSLIMIILVLLLVTQCVVCKPLRNKDLIIGMLFLLSSS